MTEPTVSILDVGHGNCAVLIDDKVVVIDAGPGTTLLDFLEKEGVTEVGVVLISHADEDHIKGLVSLLESKTVTVQIIRINSDAVKASPTWNDLTYLLDEANKAGKIQFDVGLTTNQTGQFDTAAIRIEILAPSPGLAVKGPGSYDHKKRKLTSNSSSAVVRLLRDGRPLLLLPGDIDEIGLANLLESNSDISAETVVFPHHGGGAASIGLSAFATSFFNASKPEKLIFSIGRGRYDTPRREIVAAVRGLSTTVRILCTQLSEHCASLLPSTEPSHLSGKTSKGSEFRRCCAGTISLLLKGKGTSVSPILKAHMDFIASSAPTALCVKQPPKAHE
ncbi:MAG: MBL fold metallo-hydrolase [Candidatus Korobacteraceae bacterium]|jgi:competence protein ComEC